MDIGWDKGCEEQGRVSGKCKWVVLVWGIAMMLGVVCLIEYIHICKHML